MQPFIYQEGRIRWSGRDGRRTGEDVERMREADSTLE